MTHGELRRDPDGMGMVVVAGSAIKRVVEMQFGPAELVPIHK